jgi:hypothetical protein
LLEPGTVIHQQWYGDILFSVGLHGPVVRAFCHSRKEAAMSTRGSRREFLADVGRGMLIATVGSTAAAELGLASAPAGQEPERLTFGAIEPLVSLLEETPPAKLVGVVLDQLEKKTELRRLVAASALANARSFGGEDYVGFHTMMAFAPALHMSRELPEPQRPLPAIKVLYRNSNRIHESGAYHHEVLHPVAPAALSSGQCGGVALRDAVRGKDVNAAEKTFAALAARGPEEAFNDLLFAVGDNTEVHRTVLPYRAWDLMSLIGLEQAHTFLRQSVRYCVKSEREWKHSPQEDRPRMLLPKLLDEHHLAGRTPGTKCAEDGWVDALCKTIFEGSPEHAAEAVAAALAEGFCPDAVGEAITLAANQLVLRDVGRLANQTSAGKPVGSVHGDSIGVHACDSANAWRNMARAANPRNTFACLILGGYQAAYDRVNRGGDFLHWSPRPLGSDVEPIKDAQPDKLLGMLEAAIRGGDQAKACAITHRIGELGHSARPVFDLLLKYAISEDGALHAEKFYRTVSEEFAATRPAFRWRQLVALARVTASEFGRPAPGIAEARERLKLS